MSLSVDGFWKSGFWSQTFWADGFWFEGGGVPDAPAVVPIAYWDVSAVQSKKTQRKHDLGAMLLLLG